jgi:hypothetical protein
MAVWEGGSRVTGCVSRGRVMRQATLVTDTTRFGCAASCVVERRPPKVLVGLGYARSGSESNKLFRSAALQASCLEIHHVYMASHLAGVRFTITILDLGRRCVSRAIDRGWKCGSTSLQKVDRFRGLLLFCVHVTGGQPARETDITSLPSRNRFQQDRTSPQYRVIWWSLPAITNLSRSSTS